MKIPSRQTGSNFLCLYASSDFYCRRLAAFSRHPGLVAYAAGGRGQGLAQPLAPYDPVPRVGAALLDALSACGERPPSSSLPRGSGLSDSRCPAQARDEHTSGVGGGSFLFSFFPCWPTASARHLGLVAYAAGGRGQGLAQPLAPYDPVPRVRAAILDALSAGGEGPPSSSLPRGSGLSDSRCPALRGTSVRPASELPPLRGGDLLRALPRLHQQSMLLIFFHKCQSSLNAGQEKRLSSY